MRPRPDDYREVVHPARLQTRVYLVASTPPCIRIRDEASRPKGRDYWAVAAGDLTDLEPPPRWVLAAILGPGDDASDVVRWLRARRGDPERILFILHPDTDPVQALAPWYEAGHPDPVMVEASTWIALAKPLGAFVNDWIYSEAKGSGWLL